MNLNPVILAIPMYFTLMGIELVYESITRRRTYRLPDAVTNINTGVLQQLTNTFVALFKIGVYTWVYEHFALAQLPQNAWTFVLAMILWDLCYYWEHRMAHEISLFWGGHVVHHQSEDFNLSVALRQTSTGFIWGLPFYLPMAVLGIHPVQFVLVGGLNLLYQFWIHTEHIDRLPRWFEFIFNTPSHHRVHHGRDPKYLDKNYGGILIVWDRLFGTFKEEEERPHYGITKPLRSFNPVYANFAHYIDLARLAARARSVGDALRILFKHPGWLPDYLGGPQRPPEVGPDYHKYDVQVTREVNLYVLAQFVAALALNSFYFFKNQEFALPTKVGFAVWIVWTTLTFAFLFEKRRQWLAALEVARVLVVPIGLWAMHALGGYATPAWGQSLAWVYALASATAFAWVWRREGVRRAHAQLGVNKV